MAAVRVTRDLHATDLVTAYRVSMKSLSRRDLELTDDLADLDELVNPVVEPSRPNSSNASKSESKSPDSSS